MSNLARRILAAASLLVAGLLIIDAALYATAKDNPTLERVRGCYTTVELLFGAKRPTAWARPIQFVSGAIVGFYGFVCLAHWPKSK